jgi:valyl-tRNA synthetase
VLAFVLDSVLRLFHPFVPFITEHLWQLLGERVSDRSLGGLAKAEQSALLVKASWPRRNDALADAQLREQFADLQELTRAIRDMRQVAGISPKDDVRATIRAPEKRAAAIARHGHVITSQANVSELRLDEVATRQPGDGSKMVRDIQIFVHGIIDDDAEKSRLQKELKKVKKEISICEKKLSNPKFTDRAPAEVVQEQKDRLARYQGNLSAIEASLSELG